MDINGHPCKPRRNKGSNSRIAQNDDRCAHFSKLGSLLGSLLEGSPSSLGYPKRDHRFENCSCGFRSLETLPSTILGPCPALNTMSVACMTDDLGLREESGCRSSGLWGEYSADTS